MATTRENKIKKIASCKNVPYSLLKFRRFTSLFRKTQRKIFKKQRKTLEKLKNRLVKKLKKFRKKNQT